MQPENQPTELAKRRYRAQLIAARRDRTAVARQSARDANSAHLRAALSHRTCICAFLPLTTEPLDPRLLDELAVITRVLVPVVAGVAPLDWCEYPGPVRRGDFGIDEPVGPRLGAAAIDDADAMLIPALAVDLQGHRLGRGGGHYDRTLALWGRLRGPAPMGPRIAVIYDEELVEAIPFDSLDERVSFVVTPSNGMLPTP